jgi:hypothetical protein
MRTIRQALLVGLAWAVVATGALAQTAAPEQNAPRSFDSQAPEPGRSNETLSDRLDRTDGVIKPPAGVDPKIHEPTPPTGSRMPVIPPQAVTPDNQPAQPK